MRDEGKPVARAGSAAGRQVAQERGGEAPRRVEMDDAGAVGTGDREAALGRELQQRFVARHAEQSRFGEAAGQDEKIADGAVGAFAHGVEDGVGTDDDHGEVDRRIDVGDRSHRLVTENRAAFGIDRHDSSAITGLSQELHDRAAR